MLRPLCSSCGVPVAADARLCPTCARREAGLAPWQPWPHELGLPGANPAAGSNLAAFWPRQGSGDAASAGELLIGGGLGARFALHQSADGASVLHLPASVALARAAAGERMRAAEAASDTATPAPNAMIANPAPPPPTDPTAANPIDPAAPPARRGGRSRWWWLPIALLLVILAGGGFTAWRIRDAMQTLNSVSTPPPGVSGEVFGGDAGIVIDTSAAQTVVAGGSFPTSTPAVAAAVDPTEALPTATAPAITAPTTTPTPEPTATDGPESTATDFPEPTSTAIAEPTVTDVPEATETDVPEPTETERPDPTATEIEPAATAALAPTEAQEPTTTPSSSAPTVEPTATLGLAIDPPLPSTLEPTATSELTAASEPTETAVPPTATAVSAAVDDTPTATPAATATAEPTEEPEALTATPVATATSLPNVTADPTASPTPRVIKTATPEPTPTPSVQLSEIERIEDGSFEAGAESWYLEPGAAAAETDAHSGSSVLRLGEGGGYADQRVFFVPGTAYRLSFWARLTESGDEATAGVVYYDEAAARMPDAEPEPIRLTRTRFTLVELDFTPPAGVTSVAIYFYKEAGPAALDVDDVSVRSIIPPASESELAAAESEAADGSVTILFLGVDARPGEAIDGAVRPDSLMVVHLNQETRTCRLLSIPRDTRAELVGYGYTKINHALAIGGIEYEVQMVSNLLELPIDHYVLIDFNGFEDLVDAVGGVTVIVPESFTASDNTVFTAGEQTLNGAQALSYSRDRSGPDGDFGRIQRQQQIISGLADRAAGLEVVTSVNELLPAVEDNLRTDLSIQDMISLGTTYRDICTEEEITMLRLEGQVQTLDDPLLQMPLSYVVVDEAEIRQKVASLREP